MNYTVIKKMMFVVMCVFMVLVNSVDAKGSELVVETVGAEVTVKPEKKFASYSTPEEDVVVYGGDIEQDCEEEVEEVEVEEKVYLSGSDKVVKEILDTDGIALDVVPQTGDNSNLMLWGCILAVAFVVTIVLGIFLFKKK